ncbi:hypothetical protein BDZ45DRAFT_720009 [Acephala macrosclerotiorum]|nr:hypothetical protein BDZ45DRAFT_720009 [Acephala macrosclerotiorum]
MANIASRTRQAQLGAAEPDDKKWSLEYIMAHRLAIKRATKKDLKAQLAQLGIADNRGKTTWSAEWVEKLRNISDSDGHGYHSLTEDMWMEIQIDKFPLKFWTISERERARSNKLASINKAKLGFLDGTRTQQHQNSEQNSDLHDEPAAPTPLVGAKRPSPEPVERQSLAKKQKSGNDIRNIAQPNVSLGSSAATTTHNAVRNGTGARLATSPAKYCPSCLKLLDLQLFRQHDSDGEANDECFPCRRMAILLDSIGSDLQDQDIQAGPSTANLPGNTIGAQDPAAPKRSLIVFLDVRKQESNDPLKHGLPSKYLNTSGQSSRADPDVSNAEGKKEEKREIEKLKEGNERLKREKSAAKTTLEDAISTAMDAITKKNVIIQELKQKLNYSREENEALSQAAADYQSQNVKLKSVNEALETRNKTLSRDIEHLTDIAKRFKKQVERDEADARANCLFLEENPF